MEKEKLRLMALRDEARLYLDAIKKAEAKIQSLNDNIEHYKKMISIIERKIKQKEDG